MIAILYHIFRQLSNVVKQIKQKILFAKFNLSQVQI